MFRRLCVGIILEWDFTGSELSEVATYFSEKGCSEGEILGAC